MCIYMPSVGGSACEESAYCLFRQENEGIQHIKIGELVKRMSCGRCYPFQASALRRMGSPLVNESINIAEASCECQLEMEA